MRLCGDWAPGAREVAPLPWDDLLLVNLEGPVLPQSAAAQLAPAGKAGPTLRHRAFPTVGGGGVLVLANNHAMDFGWDGVAATIAGAQARGWRWVGVGPTLAAAREPVVVEDGGARIGILARCETQFGIATSTRGGVASIEPGLESAIRALKAEVDVVIVSLHQGFEAAPWPSPRTQQFMRALIEAGADVIHGHHAHSPQGWELWKDGVIFYGLGNFCVDPGVWRSPDARWSLVPTLGWRGSSLEVAVGTTEVEVQEEVVVVRPSSPAERREHDAYLARASAPLSDPRLLEAVWQEVAVRAYNGFYRDWLEPAPSTRGLFLAPLRGLRFPASRLLGRPSAGRRIRGESERASMLLRYCLFACESHREAIATALGVLSGELPDLRSARSAALVDEMGVEF